MPRVAIVATLEAAEGSADEVLAALNERVAATDSEAGTAVYALLRDQKNPNRFTFFEYYDDDAAVKAHSEAPAHVALGPKLAGKLAGRPEIAYYEPVSAKGLTV